MLDWIINNKDWIFSGIGVFVLGGIIALAKLISKKNKDSAIISQKQKNGEHSTNSQIAVQNNFGGEKDE